MYLQDIDAFEEQEMNSMREFISQFFFFLQEDKWALNTFLKDQSTR